MDTVSIVIGSWGSYNECNERALGSKWLDLSEFESYDDITEELEKEGFELDGIDEELFVQDIEGLPNDAMNWDCCNIEELFNTLKESGVLDDSRKYDTMQAYLEVRSYSEFEDLVDRHGSNWDEDIYLYENYDWDDYGRELFDCCGYNIPSNLENYIDFSRYGEDMGQDYAEEYSNGIIEIRY